MFLSIWAIETASIVWRQHDALVSVSKYTYSFGVHDMVTTYRTYKFEVQSGNGMDLLW